MKLSTKISFSMGTLTVIIAILAVYLLVQMGSINNISTILAGRNIPVIDVAGKLNNDVSEYRIVEVRHIYATDATVMQANEKELADWKKAVTGYLAELNRLVKVGDVKAALDKVNSQLNGYFSISDKLLDISRQNHTEEAVKLLLGDSRQVYRDLSAQLNELVTAARKNAESNSAQGDEMYANSNMVGTALTVLAILIAVLLTVLVVRNTVRQLGKDPGELNAIAHRVVDGDYNVDDGGKKMGVYGAIVEMVNALKTHIENAQRESENAREQSAKAQEAMRQIVENTAEGLGMKAVLKYAHVVHPVINDDDDLTEIAQKAVVKLFGEETLCHMPAMMGSEDFANYAAEIPAVFGFIGCRDEANGMIYNNHHEKFTVNESLLPKGTALMAQFAVDYLAGNA